MKRAVRTQVFETNSSSVHAIVINSSDKITIPRSIHFGIGCFGWDCEKLSTVRDKADYLYTALLSLYTGDELQERLNDIESTLRNINVENITFDDDYTVSSQKNDNDKVYNMFDGYIDHYYTLTEWIEDLACERLINYLFGSNSYVYTGNDNNEEDYPKYDNTNDYFIKGN